MSEISDFISMNASLLVSILALVISLVTNAISRKAGKLSQAAKEESDRILLFEKKREMLNEVDRQNARMGTFLMITVQKVILLNDHPDLRKKYPDEYGRLLNNLNCVQTLRSKHEEQRSGLERIGDGFDITKQDEILANIRCLSIYIDEEISKEERGLKDFLSKISE